MISSQRWQMTWPDCNFISFFIICIFILLLFIYRWRGHYFGRQITHATVLLLLAAAVRRVYGWWCHIFATAHVYRMRHWVLPLLAGYCFNWLPRSTHDCALSDWCRAAPQWLIAINQPRLRWNEGQRHGFFFLFSWSQQLIGIIVCGSSWHLPVAAQLCWRGVWGACKQWMGSVINL